MKRFWQRLSLRAHFLILSLLVIAAGTYTALMIAKNIYDIIQQEHNKYLFAARLNEARSIADMMDNVGTWATHFNGLWARAPKDDLSNVGSFLDQECYKRPDPKDAAKTEEICFQRKNPALIQREVADVIKTSEMRAKPRIVSDKFVNPNNAPNRFEAAAIEAIREGNKNEYYETKYGELLYAHKIIGTKGCLKCHGTAEEAPATMKDKYPLSQGYGYEVGKVVGIISVRLPFQEEENAANVDFSATMKRMTWSVWLGLGAFAITLLAVFIEYSNSVVKSLRRLTAATLRARDSEIGEHVEFPTFVKDEHSSKNEVHQLSHAVKALQESLSISRELGEQSPPPAPKGKRR